MNIVYITYAYWPPKFGGELLLSIERFEELVKRGHKVIVLTSGVPGLPAHEIKNGIEIFRSPIITSSRIGRSFRRLSFPIWVNKLLSKLSADVIHIGGAGGVELYTIYTNLIWVNKIAQSKGAKTVYVHSLADAEKTAFTLQGRGYRLRKKFFMEVDAIVSVSPKLHHAVQQFYPDKATLIPNAARNDIFKPLSPIDRSKLRAEYGINEQEIIFVFLGTVSQRKGFDILAQAFAELSPKHPAWRLWVIGPRTIEENQNIDPAEVAHICSPLLRIENRVHYWGRINDRQKLALLLSLSDIYVLPTLKEGMPLSPIEAMACGIPVIVSLLPGITDITCVDGQTGLFVEPGDVNSLIKAMTLLGEQSDKRLYMGNIAAQRVSDHFGWSQHLSTWETFYLNLANQRTN